MSDSKRPGVSLEEIRSLIKLVETYGLLELYVESDGVRLSLRTGSSAVEGASHAPEVPAAAYVPPPLVDAQAEQAVPVEDESRYAAITAPMAGVFYRTPRPDEPPFVEEGDTVEVGQTVGLIEAMKVFSPVLSDVSGRVVLVKARNGSTVQEGEVLMLVEPLEGASST
ncbi:MAG: acetyl-CoA carboxylase biotin carboxyl carrier protein [Armatimonadota bacterium]